MRYPAQPPWEFLLSASRISLQSFELSRLSHAANLRKEIGQLLDSWLEENTAAMLARWLMEHAERSKDASAGGGEAVPISPKGEIADAGRAKGVRAASYNIFVDETGSPPAARFRS